ncbi:MAG: hypothetical protein RL113_167 [Pseudomonadota bacterium]|jgi:hypothetical protein
MVRLKFFAFLFMYLLLIQGCFFQREPDMDDIVEKIVAVETPNGNYTAVNSKTGAYGRYQIKPYIAAYYAKKLGIPYNNWKTPANQDRIFRALLSDNIQCLKNNGHEINTFTVYGAHQQGATGFDNIIKNRSLSDDMYARLRRNVPAQYRNCSDKELCDVWVCYWKKKLS